MYRFYYHYNKPAKKMSVHFRQVCYIVDDIICNVPCETKWNETQPYVVMRGHAEQVIIKKNTAYIK